jgi:hypothetical protein
MIRLVAEHHPPPAGGRDVMAAAAPIGFELAHPSRPSLQILVNCKGRTIPCARIPKDDIVPATKRENGLLSSILMSIAPPPRAAIWRTIQRD